MRRPQTTLAALALVGVVALGAGPAVAAPRSSSATAGSFTIPAKPTPRASLHLDFSRSGVWVGQALPITVRATFRNVEGVTLEGAPELKSEAIFTSTLPQQPRQATEVIDGQPVLVATWKGTITPSAAGPLAVSIALPVRLRYRDAPVELAPTEPEQDQDPFDAFNIDPTNLSSIDHLFQSFEHSFSRGFAQPLGEAHEETATLTAAARPIEVRALPLAGQPAGFSGAVGKFELRASLPAASARVAEPLTLTVTLEGEGDLDRVELAGVAPSADFKTYPPSSKTEAGVPGKKLAQRRFEQVLIPLHGGTLTIPPVELPVFDPAAGRYTMLATAPLPLAVEGAPAQATATTPALPSPPATRSLPAEASAKSLPLPTAQAVVAFVERPRTLLFVATLLLVAALGGMLLRFRRRPSRERSLRRAVRRSAKQGSPSAFFAAARHLIVVHFSKRWGVSEEEITADALRTRLGETAEPLVTAITTADALRFGRREVPASELIGAWASIEASLRRGDAKAA